MPDVDEGDVAAAGGDGLFEGDFDGIARVEPGEEAAGVVVFEPLVGHDLAGGCGCGASEREAAGAGPAAGFEPGVGAVELGDPLADDGFGLGGGDAVAGFPG